MNNIDNIVDVINKVVPDVNLQDQIKLELVKALNDGTIKMEELQVEKAQIESKIKLAILERLAIPAVIYTFLFILVHNSVIAPYIELIWGVKIPILELQGGMYDLIGWITGGVMVKKSVDSVTKNKK
jgi:hypothetical protein